MRALAIETTETTGSVAAACDGNLLLELKLSSEIRSAQSLAPGLKTLLERVGWRPTDVELVAVATGPGSFTGLRVGVTTAKTLAYCVGARILGVDTLEVIAAAAPAEVERLWAAVDAQRGQVVAQLFARGPEGHFLALAPAELLDADLWLARLAPATCLSGPVLRKLASRVPSHLTVLDPRYWSASAAAVAELAVRRYRAGQRDDVWSVVPRYSRRSAAEEKWDAAGAPGKPGR